MRPHRLIRITVTHCCLVGNEPTVVVSVEHYNQLVGMAYEMSLVKNKQIHDASILSLCSTQAFLSSTNLMGNLGGLIAWDGKASLPQSV